MTAKDDLFRIQFRLREVLKRVDDLMLKMEEVE